MSPDTPKKRKADPKPSSPPTKRSRAERERKRERTRQPQGCPTPAAPKNALVGPHESIIAALSARNDVLAASVISSSRLGKRTAHITSHLLRAAAEEDTAAEGAAAEGVARPRLALLHARPADVCKMISVAELCKRTLGESGARWFQYNQMFELPEEELEREGRRRERRRRRRLFESAVLPPPRARTTRSLRIFLSLEPIPDLRSRPDVTTQTSEET
ncbi:hypothetical protein ESCO_006234 [Escovopsis weberi]|uniref:DNA/RNA-binding protein Alba-like domain-containing protein n=1 Tax=Escovopsis weberi TaxID=150374 RepID=A0A0M9VUW3_ESCWE|nr:hypothetical protein ESCO_006234 [Escovopsis weberi]